MTITVLSLLLACTGSGDDTGGTGSPSGDGGTVDTNPDCDPLVPDYCGMPFPSSYYLDEDSSTASGWRVALGPTTMPMDIDGVQPDPKYWNEFDGFSPLGTLVVYWPDVSLDGAISHTDLGAYEAADAKTVIIDVDTGQRMPHFVELDMSGDDDARRVLMIRPVAPLAYGHHYVVGMRGFVDTSGAAIAPSDAFAALRDGTPTGDSRVDDRQDLYDSVIFPTLEADGWQRDDTQLAWDFVVGSKEGLTGRMVWMRDDALTRVGDGGPSYVIDEVIEPYSEAFGRVIKGHMTVPYYTESDTPPTMLTRDADGWPTYNGDTDIPFVIAVPQSLLDDPHPAPLVQYGHGFFGEFEEAYDTWADWNEQLATDNEWIYFAVEWTGMKAEDLSYVSLMVTSELDGFPMLPERTMQGFVEFLVAARAMKGDLGADDQLTATHPKTGATVPLADPDRMWFYGVSQGGILGGAYMSLSTDITRGVLGVPGTPFSFLTTRSKNFDPQFFTLFRTKYPDPVDITWWLSALQIPWDVGDGAAYAPTLGSGDRLDGVPEKQILIQAGVGDAQVPTLGAHMLARSIGASMVGTPVREIWGLSTMDSGGTGSAITEWDYGVEEPVENRPASNDVEDVHDNVRHEATSQAQLKAFFEQGIVIDPCDGGCDPD